MRAETRVTEDVLGCRVDAVGWDRAVQTVMRWAAARESRYVCHCNVHAVVTARHDARLRRALNDADLVTPDGMPIAWWLRGVGHKRQPRVDGPDLMWKLCTAAARDGQRIYLYGGSVETLARLRRRLAAAFPDLAVVGAESPPFAERAVRADAGTADRINESVAQLVFVGLGCPTQEQWMKSQRGHVRAVMLGVGAAFDYHAGTLRRAPSWLRRLGLEWAYRLGAEPRRLWRRYAVTNSLFLLYAAGCLLRRVSRATGAKFFSR
jgi:N-acetylglucosaminyldiphosphoundecaprenol N-acetyl-beta-D-mannosaminyltransferase